MNLSVRNQLEIRVSGQSVGILEKIDTQKHVFTYLPDTPETHFVSLTMPARAESYVWEKGLHPIFQMNLPEGYRKDRLREKFGPVATVDDFSLLALTGTSARGRITAHPRNTEGKENQSTSIQHRPIADILTHRDSRGALLEYLAETIVDGISGVMPKALADDERITLKTPDWILKTGREDTPGVCVNEYICLKLAEKIGLPVPSLNLSSDGEVLAVARFDIDKEGRPRGLEDMCSLLGMAPAEKYETTAEQIERVMSAFVADNQQLNASRRFVDMLLLNAAIRNADAHSKNYALLYSDRSDVTLAPAYDILTVHAYASYARNPYAILIGGTKSWNLRKPLEKFSVERLNLESAYVSRRIDNIASEMAATTSEIEKMASAYPNFRGTSTKMLHAWSEGIATLSDRTRGTTTKPTKVSPTKQKKVRLLQKN